MRSFIKFLPVNRNEFVSRLFIWAAKKSAFCILNTDEFKNQIPGYSGFKFIAGIGAFSELKGNSGDNEFANLENYIKRDNGFLMGFLNYDLKNQTEKLVSKNTDQLEMPLLHFFEPELIFDFSVDEEQIEVGYFTEKYSEEDIQSVCRSIETDFRKEEFIETKKAKIVSRVSKEEYIENVRKIKEHIQLGDVYELNYCIEFFAKNVEINPVQVYEKLNEISPAPFSCFYKVDNKYLICASPERFLKKEDNKITAQPMKGTARRSQNKIENEQIKQELFTDEKERAENVMIVDLVRNDLSKTATKKSVKVDELFGIYSFPQVHQMVSTVSAEMRDNVSIVDVIKSAFPMGSMTGAPKVKAMELIEKFELTRRGLFSGAVGYITPQKDFDFNVVIRSIQYNADNKYLSFMVGSAITINSDPEKEYEECLLKAQAMIEVLK